MPRQSLSEVIDGRLISGASEIVPTSDEPVRAVDVASNIAAVYRFSVDPTGQWFQQCTMAFKTPDGSWVEGTAGGSHGEGWQVPWRPSDETLDGHSLAIFGSAGMDVGDAPDLVLARGIYGFAGPPIRHLRVSSERGERTVSVDSPVGAFVVVTLGEGVVEFQGLDEAGVEVGQPANTAPIS
jgi:hypothetical protein